MELRYQIAKHTQLSTQDSLLSYKIISEQRKGETRVFNSTGCRRRPSVYIPHDMLLLHLDLQFSLKKIG